MGTKFLEQSLIGLKYLRFWTAFSNNVPRRTLLEPRPLELWSNLLLQCDYDCSYWVFSPQGALKKKNAFPTRKEIHRYCNYEQVVW